jgi:cold shock CspA family protein
VKKGTVVTYNEDRGFGFIRELDSKMLSHIFFHVSGCLCVPQKGLTVQFEIGPGKKGPQAINVDAFNADAITGVAGIEALAGGAL